MTFKKIHISLTMTQLSNSIDLIVASSNSSEINVCLIFDDSQNFTH